jgi:hypothetical protein
MNDETITRVHWSFWVITTITLIWNVLGVVNFLFQMDPQMVESYRETERAIIEGRPGWATVGFALAVFGGSLGCLLLLFRNAISLYLFMISLIGVVITMIHTLSVGIDFSMGEYLGIILLPFLVAVYLIWYTIRVKAKAWVR